MPIYEYECTACGNVTEAWQKFSESPLKTCDACGGRLKKIISQTTFHLKGTGWYVTDYASKSGGGAGCSSSAPKVETKSETKAETSGSKKESAGGSKPSSDS